MSFTRFNDDPCRIKKQNQEATDPGKYILNQPGWGDKPCFMDDPYIRMQEWGANLRTNSINLESDLMGLTRPLNNRDCNYNNYQKINVKSNKISYPTCSSFTDQSRVTNPAWKYRDLEQVDWYILPLNPQENTCIPFQNNLSTRILEKDYFVTKAPCVKKSGYQPLATQPFVGFGSKTNVNNCSTTQTCENV